MKTRQVIQIISLSLIFNACQPKDKAVVTPKERDQILEMQNAKRTPNNGLMKLGSFGAAAFLLDQQAESLNWIMYLFNGPYVGNGYSAVTDKDKNFPLLQNNGTQKSSHHGIYNNIGELEVNIRKLEQGVLEKMTVNGNETIQFESGQLQISSSITDHRSVEIRPEGNDQFTVRVEKDGELNLTKAGKLEKVKYTFNSMMIVKLDLAQKTIAIVKSITSLKILRTPELNFRIESENELQYQFNQQCVSTVGKVKVVDVKNSAKNKTLIVDEKSARIEGTNWTFEFADCAQRPLVDVYKLLKY